MYVQSRVNVMSDRMALMDLYECTLGVRWHNSLHWTSERSSRHWFGVTVDVAGRVRGLDLSGNLLQGSIHDCKSFGRLTHLESLCLESNGIQGPIPSSIGTLTSLLELNLSWNQLEGEIGRLESHADGCHPNAALSTCRQYSSLVV